MLVVLLKMTLRNILCDICECCSPLGIPIVSGEVGHGFHSSRLFLPLLFPHFFLTTFFINSPQLLLSFAVVLHSSSTLSRHLLTQSSHHNLGFPRLLFPFHSLGICFLFQLLISHSIHMTSPFQPTLRQFLLNIILHSNLQS